MPNLAENSQCTGCGVCAAVCLKDAISMVPDREGFKHPKADPHLCVNCGRCEQVCPLGSVQESRRPLGVFAAQAKAADVRSASSSGGLFSLLSRRVIAREGIVFGAAFDKSDWHVRHQSAESEDELADLRGSKYVQSDAVGVYSRVKKELDTGRLVLFSGTPCQIAGLRCYLGREYGNLLLVDVVCHGVPSPMVWQKYLKWQSEAALAEGRGSAPAEDGNIRRISFRRKNCGWKRYSLSLRFANDKEYLQCHKTEPFMQAFLRELCNRPSCYHCKYRGLRSGSDLTLADFWGIEKHHPELDDDSGTSLLLVNTLRGKNAVEEVLHDCNFCLSSYEVALLENPAIIQSPCPHNNRRLFFEFLMKLRFDRAVRAALIGRKAELMEFYYSSRPRLVNSYPMRIVRAIRRWLHK